MFGQPGCDLVQDGAHFCVQGAGGLCARLLLAASVEACPHAADAALRFWHSLVGGGL